MADANGEFQSALLERLDALIALVMEQATPENMTLTKKVLKLSDYGFSNKEIATIVGKSSHIVGSTLAEVKKHKRRKGK